MKLIIGYLYPDLMNIYGDTGNVITLQKRCQWRGIEAEVKLISQNSELISGECDLYFFGGGQDQSQGVVAKDLIKKGKVLKGEVDRGAPLLSICGGYQLLGEYYQPHEGDKLEGLGIFPAYTEASDTRMIGNIVIETSVLSSQSSDSPNTDSKAILKSEYLVGFENHSGKTYLKKDGEPLGRVKRGFGNNGKDRTEGCIYKNAIGCYMHGSLLPKNPQLTDWLIQKALEVKYGEPVELEPLDDSLELQAQKYAVSRFS